MTYAGERLQDFFRNQSIALFGIVSMTTEWEETDRIPMLDEGRVKVNDENTQLLRYL